LVEIQISNSSKLKGLELLSLSDRNTYLFCCVVLVWVSVIACLNIALFEMALTQFCLHVLHMWEDDDIPLFTEETFKRYAARLAATATVQAATGMLVNNNSKGCHWHVGQLQ
jgi:hypothetical protein